jgi:hypothetical protein
MQCSLIKPVVSLSVEMKSLRIGENKWGMVADVCNLSSLGSTSRRILSWRPAPEKLIGLFLKIKI